MILLCGAAAARAQETEAAAESRLLQIMLPQSAQRVLPGSVPAEVTQTFEKVIAAGQGKLRQGDTEVLLFAGGGYKKANAATIVNRFASAVKDAGWKYQVLGEENGVTLFSAVQESPRRRGVIGFYGAADAALILAAMEVLPNEGNGLGNGNGQTASEPAGDETQTDQSAPAPVKSAPTATGGSVIGKWTSGYSSILAGYVPSVGPKTFTPGRSHYFGYEFHRDGTYTFTGIMQNTVYSCTTTIFNDERGTYRISGDQITFTKTKNFFRRSDTCSAANNLEINHTLGTDTYTFGVSRGQSGKEQICLSKDGNTPCYERAQE